MDEFYGSWTIKEVDSEGKEFKAIGRRMHGYEEHITAGKEYTIKMIGRILSLSPLCEFVGDTGKACHCHIERFEKIQEV